LFYRSRTCSFNPQSACAIYHNSVFYSRHNPGYMFIFDFTINLGCVYICNREGADHLTFEGGDWKIHTVQEFFPPRGTRQIFFPVKVQRKIFFSQYISRQNIFFCLIITAYSNLGLSYSYRQRRSRVELCKLRLF
jgi:hypothetical protein